MSPHPVPHEPAAGAAGGAPDRSRWRRQPLQALVTPVGLAWLGLILSLIVLFLRLSAADPAVLGMWLSSDTLYPVNVFTDIFIDGYSLSGWQFSIAPCWFPDLVLVGLFLGLTQNVILATLFAGFIQIPLIIGAFVLIGRAVRTAQPMAQHVVLVGVGIGITLFVAIQPGLYYPGLYQFFLPQTHVGSLCVVLYGLALALLCVRQSYESERLSWRLPLIYGLVCLASGMSNLLYLVHMLAPLTVSLAFAVVFTLLPLRVCLVPIGIGWPAALLGVVLNRVLFNTTDVSAQSAINYERAMLSLDVFMRGAVAHLLARDPLHLLAILWAILCILYLLAAMRSAVMSGASHLSLSQRMSVTFFLSCFLSAVMSIGAIVIGGSNGLADFKNYVWTMHYLHPAFLLPLFGLPLALSWIVRIRVIPVNRTAVLPVGALAVVAPAYCLANTWLPPSLIHHYVPPFVRSVDDLAQREGLHYGLGGYWQARLVTLLSKHGVRAYAVNGDLEPFLWVSNREWYSQEYRDRKKRPPVDFVILDDPLWKISRERVIRLLGEPAEEARCDGARVLIYRRRPLQQ